MNAIFISHSSKDNPSVNKLRAYLKASGYQALFLDYDPVDGIPAGRRWEEELYARLRQCRAVIVICSEVSMGSPWCFAEITHARALGKYLFPFKIDNCTVTSLLHDVQIIDVTTSGWQEAYQRLGRGLVEKGLDPKKMFFWDETRPPYPGLLSFQKEDAAVFFGRDAEINAGLDLFNRLKRFGGTRIIVVLGASGTGKSSLARAGILPIMDLDQAHWLVVDPFRPAKQPIGELAKVLADRFQRSGHPRDWKMIRATLNKISRGAEIQEFLDLLDDLCMGANSREATVLLTIDQAEELFNASRNIEHEAFLSFFRQIIDAAGDRLMLLATLRSDFLGHFQQHPRLQDLPFESLTVGSLSSAGMRRVIEGPADVSGIILEDGLADQLLNDAKTPDALPLLAFTLREMWERHGNAENRFKLDDYIHGLGGLDGSIRRATYNVLRSYVQHTRKGRIEKTNVILAADDERDLRNAFLSLVQVNEEGQYTRRASLWTEMPVAVKGLLQRLVDARLLVSHEQVIEVAHEAIFRSWDKLREWLLEDREFLLWRRRLQVALEEWAAIGSPQDDGLLRGGALATARAWTAQHFGRLSTVEKDFIEQSSDQEERQRRLASRRLYVAQISLAHRAWDEGNLELARDLLEAQLPNPGEYEQRGFEWYYLWHLCHSEISDLFHDDAVTAVAFGDNENLIASASRDGSIRTWNPQTGRPIQLLQTGGPNVQPAHALAFSENGSQLTSVHSGGGLLRWQLSTYLFTTLRAGERYISNPAITPKSSEAAWVEDGTVRVWAFATGQERISPELNPSWVIHSLAISPDGLMVALATGTGEIALWEASSHVWRTAAQHPGMATCVAFSADGSLLASGGQYMAITITDLVHGNDLETKPAGQTDMIQSLAFSADGRMLAAGTADPSNPSKAGVLLLLDVQTGQARTVKGHIGSVDVLAFSPDDKHLASGGSDHTVQVREPRHIPEWTTLSSAGPGRIFAVTFSPNGERLATGSEGSSTDAPGLINIWNLATLVVDQSLAGHASEVSTVAFNPTGEILLSGSPDATLRLWDARNWSEPPLILKVDFPVRSVAFAPDGTSMAAGGGTPTKPGKLKIWHTTNQGPATVIDGYADTILCCTYSPNSKLIATASADYSMTKGEIRIWDVGKKEPLPPLQSFRSWTRCVSFSTDGSLIATGSGSLNQPGNLKLWSVRTQEPRLTLKGHQHSVQSVDFSPDGRTLASASGPGNTHHAGEVKLWDIATGQEIVTLRGYDHWVYQLAFAPNARALATVSGDTTVRLWSGSAGSAVIRYFEQWRETNPDDLDVAIKLISAYWGFYLEPDSRSEDAESLIVERLSKGQQLLLDLQANSHLSKDQESWIIEFEKALEGLSESG